MGLLDRYGEGNAKDSKKKDKKAKKHKRKKEGKEKKQKHKKDTKDRKRKKEKARRSSSSSSSSSSSCDTPTQTHAKTDIGPSLPPATATIGPAMPPGITGDIGPAGPPPGWKPATVGSGSGSDDDIGIGPAGPPPGWAGRVDKGGEHDSDDERKEAGLPSLPVNSAQDDQGEDGGGGGGTRGPMMPMLPAGVRREDLEKLKAETNKIDWQRLAVEEEEEEEDLLGPVAPGQVTRGYVKASMAAEQRAHLDMLAKVEADEAAKLPKHEDWMSMVPEVKSLGFNLDDAQKNRTFLRREKADRGDISEWTDTPADKARREREKELGIAGFKRKPEAACVVDTATATKHTVEQYNRTVRGKTLVEIHREEQKKKKASTGRKAGEVALGQWDRSEITQTRVKDDKAIERVFQDATGAGGLGGRFGNSSFHGF